MLEKIKEFIGGVVFYYKAKRSGRLEELEEIIDRIGMDNLDKASKDIQEFLKKHK